MRDITLNRIPVLTWRWLKMNETAVSIPKKAKLYFRMEKVLPYITAKSDDWILLLEKR